MKILLTSSLILISLILLICPYGHSQQLYQKKIFFVHSYERGHVCGQPQYEGCIRAIEDSGFLLKEGKNFKVFYMDTKRRFNTPEKIRERANIALKLIEEFSPDILVTFDDNAFRYVGLSLVDISISIVFSGMNFQPEYYHKIIPCIESRERPGHNITGVYEKLHFIDALKVQSKILGTLDKVVVFVERYSPTGRALLRQIEQEIKDERPPCKIEIRVVKSWEHFKEEIRRIRADPHVSSLYPAALLLKDRYGNSYTAPEIFSWITGHLSIPSMAINYAFVKLGLFGGVGVDFRAMGYQAGQMVVKILNGKRAGEIPIEDAKRYALVFNLSRARELRINIPEDILMAADEVIAK